MRRLQDPTERDYSDSRKSGFMEFPRAKKTDCSNEWVFFSVGGSVLVVTAKGVRCEKKMLNTRACATPGQRTINGPRGVGKLASVPKGQYAMEIGEPRKSHEELNGQRSLVWNKRSEDRCRLVSKRR